MGFQNYVSIPGKCFYCQIACGTFQFTRSVESQITGVGDSHYLLNRLPCFVLSQKHKGGFSSEREVSFGSGREVAWAMEQLGYKFETFDIADDFYRDLMDFSPDVAFMALLGGLERMVPSRE